MIANARMYAVSAPAASLWRDLLAAIARSAAVPLVWVEHAAPAAIDDLWRRPDKGAVFMCGLPYSRSVSRPQLLAAPVPSPADFADQPQYWSELVVREDSAFRSIEDTYGRRLALTVPDSQSGCAAALVYFMTAAAERSGPAQPLYREIIAPTGTPLGALRAVIEGAADVAPIDAYAYALLRKFRPESCARSRVVARTARTAIPPLVSNSAGAAALQAAFLQAHRDATLRSLMDELLLARFVRPDSADYDRLRNEFEAAARYWGARPLAAAVHPAFNQLFGGGHAN